MQTSSSTMLMKLARWLSNGPLCARGRALFEANTKEWLKTMSKMDKLLSGAYIILHDYADGVFPPVFEDQKAAYAAEVSYRDNLSGLTSEQVSEGEMQKPFWFGVKTKAYLSDYIRLVDYLAQYSIQPPSSLLELGAGGGWLAELLAVTGFEVTGTSLSPHDIADARKRIDSIRCKGLQRNLKFEVAAMESVSEAVGPRNYYDGVYVYEALHHAFDWRQAVESAYACLKPGGWMMICNEPNVMHTFISYRIARLSNTHEIGFSKSELICHLMNTGFEEVHYLGRKWHFWVSAHWVFARKKK